MFARNDRGKYGAPAPTVRCADDDVGRLHAILRSRVDDLTQPQREMIEETCFREEPRHQIAARRGIRVNTRGTRRIAAFRTRRDSMITVGDSSTDIDLPD